MVAARRPSTSLRYSGRSHASRAYHPHGGLLVYADYGSPVQGELSPQVTEGLQRPCGVSRISCGVCRISCLRQQTYRAALAVYRAKGISRPEGTFRLAFRDSSPKTQNDKQGRTALPSVVILRAKPEGSQNGEALFVQRFFAKGSE